MLHPVSADDWPAIDSWWGSFEQDQSVILASPSIRDLPNGEIGNHWSSVDSLWDAFESDHETLFAEQNVQALSDDSEEEAWATVDALWTNYSDLQQDDLQELRRLMAELQETWEGGASTFDEDPLTANWRPTSQYEGPLRTTVNEEDWSQWLAHLIRTSSGPFAHALLGTPDRPPTRVRREVVFFDDNSERRVDILVEYENRGVSIEVKQGDEHYAKTPETAGLIEQNDRRDWSHILLLQKAQLPRLQQTFGDGVEQTDEGSPTVQSDQSADIDIRYWQDVSQLLRQLLCEGREPDSHWQASAYLFITLIEQRVLRFHSFSFVTPDTAGRSASAPMTDLHRLVVAEPDEQIDYLRAVLQEDHNHE